MVVCERATRSVAHTHDRSLATQGSMNSTSKTGQTVCAFGSGGSASSDKRVRERALRPLPKTIVFQPCSSCVRMSKRRKKLAPHVTKNLRTSRQKRERERKRMFFDRNFLAQYWLTIAVVHMNLLLEIILKDRGSRENAFIRRNVLSVESEGGKKKNGQNNGRLSKSANNENPCSKLYRVYIYIYIYTQMRAMYNVSQ